EQAQVLEIGRLFVCNLPYTATEDELAELFKKYDGISQVHLVVDKDTRRLKGFGYVLYMRPESAVRLLVKLVIMKRSNLLNTMKRTERTRILSVKNFLKLCSHGASQNYGQMISSDPTSKKEGENTCEPLEGYDT
ncbi:hypothetical protein AMTR_s04055p00007480, partial [Amborella trichopoda]